MASYITSKSVIAVGAVLPGLATIAVALRFYSRRLNSVHLGIDDWLIVCSLILTIGMGIMLIVGSALHALAQPTPSGHGPKGFMTVLNYAIVTTEKISFTFDLVQPISFGLAKLSVLFFYRRIFRGRIFDLMSWTMIAIVIAWIVSFFCAVLFRCGTNYWAYWSTLEALLSHCNDSTKNFQAFSISDVIADGLILLLPIYWTWKLQMPVSRRLQVCGIFLLGAVAIAAGIARLVVYIEQTTNFATKADGIGHLTAEMYWSMIEMGLCVVAACLPTMRPIFGELSTEKLFRSFRSMFSLPSMSSLRSRRDQHSEHANIRQDYDEISNASKTRFMPKDVFASQVQTETHVMSDLECQSEIPSQAIRVQKEFSHRSSTDSAIM